MALFILIDLLLFFV